MKSTLTAIALLAAAGIAPAQTDVTAAPAELAIPFGVAQGQLALVGDQMIFMDAQNASRSFAIERDNLREATWADGVLTVRTVEKLGDRSEFTFRVDDPDFPDAAISWGSRSIAPAVAPRPAGGAPAPAEDDDEFRLVYSVENKRFLNSNDQGRLIFTDDRVSYESVTNINQSEQWDLKDIKEMKRKNPYKLKIEPFLGDAYTFNLLREGMSSREFQQIVDRLAGARAPE